MLHTRQAWAYAKLDRPAAFRRSCEKAAHALSSAEAESPYWIEYFDESELTGTIGGRLLDMAHTTPALAAEAVTVIEAAIRLRGPQCYRSSALDRLGLAEAWFLRGEPEHACTVGSDALAVVARTPSDRVKVKLAELDGVAARYYDVNMVRELRDTMSPLLSS
jgi:hypothetical protein